MPNDETVNRSSCWHLIVKLQGETPHWDIQVLRDRLDELAMSFLEIMSSDVTVIAVISDSPTSISSSTGSTGRAESGNKDTEA